LGTEISELITLTLHKQIDDDAYNRQYQKLNQELTDLKYKKIIDKNSLQRTKNISKMTDVKNIPGDGLKPLSAFDIEALVEKVIIRSQTEYEFHFESGQIMKVK